MSNGPSKRDKKMGVSGCCINCCWFSFVLRCGYYLVVSVRVRLINWTLRFPAKEIPNMEKALLDWPIVLQHDVKAKYRLISTKFSGTNVFHPSVRLTI